MALETTAQTRAMAINVLSAVPDDRLCAVGVKAGSSGLEIAVPGTANLLPYLPPGAFKLNLLAFDPESRAQPKLGPGPILNHIGDADRCGLALRRAAELVARAGRPCFNHPASVLRTTRDKVARGLAGIAGLRVPKVMRHAFDGLDGLKSALLREGLAFPVILRIAGDHGGVSAVRAETPAQLDVVYRINPFGKTLYVTEYVEYKSSDGRYRKFRVAVIGKQILLRHMIVSDGWLIHSAARAANTAAEERRMLEHFASERQAALEPIFLEIARRLDLDWFGVDFHLGEDFTVTLFEANACMNILANTSPSPNMWDAPIARIRTALLKHLRTPAAWRHPNEV